MGVFDYVDFSTQCPGCGNEIKNFQTKSGARLLGTVKPWSVDNFYAYCVDCEKILNYFLKEEYDIPCIDKLFATALQYLDLMRKGGTIPVETDVCISEFIETYKGYYDSGNPWLKKYDFTFK